LPSPPGDDRTRDVASRCPTGHETVGSAAAHAITSSRELPEQSSCSITRGRPRTPSADRVCARRGRMRTSSPEGGVTIMDNAKQTVAAGPLTFVVEFRRSVEEGVSIGGPTIRVNGTEDAHEYLRIDMFDHNPHYHYEPPGDVPERRLFLDTVAEGDPVEWGLD